MQRVFASQYIDSVFARRLQVRYSHPRDSRAIVKPFSQVINKMTMDFATLGPSGYSRRLPRLIDQALTLSFRFMAPGRLHNLYNTFTV